MKPESRTSDRNFAVDQIMSFVKEHQLAAGSKLPSERELAAQLNLSRHIVREAYHTLSAQGVVLIEHGRGVFLSTPQETPYAHPLIVGSTDMKNIINLLEVRQITECGAIPFAMERARPEDYNRIRELVAADDGRLYLNDSVFIPSISFESEIINLTGNPALINLEKNILDAWKYLWVRLKLSTVKSSAHNMEHYEILDAMEKGDVKLAQKSLHAHLSSILLVIDHVNH